MSPSHAPLEARIHPGSNLYYATLFLPAQKRHALQVFCSFYRAIVGVLHTVSDPDVARHKLLWWEHEVRAAFAGRATHPLWHTLMPVAHEHGITPTHLLTLLDGCHTQLGQTRYLGFSQLTQALEPTAGMAATVCTRILQPTSPPSDAYGCTLGLACQLTALLRNLGSDAARGRIHMPIDDMQRFGVTAQDVLRRTPSASLAQLVRFQAQRIHPLYDAALAHLPVADRPSQKAGLIALGLSRALLRRLEAAPLAVLDQRVSLSPLHKLYVAWKIQALGRF